MMLRTSSAKHRKLRIFHSHSTDFGGSFAMVVFRDRQPSFFSAMQSSESERLATKKKRIDPELPTW
jgi:hypothetical protein